MQIIKDSNNVVIFAGSGFSLTETGLIADGWTAPFAKSTTHTLEEVQTIPEDFSGGDYTYDVEWALTESGTAKRQAQFIAAKAQKQAELTAYAKTFYHQSCRNTANGKQYPGPC